MYVCMYVLYDVIVHLRKHNVTILGKDKTNLLD